MSYGYEPPKPSDEGSWGEVWAIIKVVVGMLLPVIAIMFGMIIFVAVSIMFFLVHPALLLLSAAVVAAGVWYLARRDRRLQDEEKRRIFGDRH